MPRRVDSDDDSKPPRKKSGAIQKPRPRTARSKTASKKSKPAQDDHDPAILAPTTRRTVESLDGIEDVDSVSLKRERDAPAFQTDDDIERVPPVAQLAVHKNKVAEVLNWLQGFPQHRKKLLVLSGPAGAGKSTTIQSLARQFGIQIVEWINPVDESKLTSQSDEIESLSRKFSVFVQNAQRYAAIESPSRQIILIQDLPNTIGSSSLMAHARQLFQTAIKESLMSMRVRYPIVLIVTESEVGTGEDFGYSSIYHEGLTVKGLLGDDILNHPAASHIKFNPIAKTIMLRALQTIPQFKLVPKGLLQSIIGISAGDIRSAINCTALVTMQLHHSPRLKADISILAGLECREGGLDLFHAAGRVVYNKRFGDDSEDPVTPVPSLPTHLAEWTRRPSKVDIEDLLTSVQTDTSTLCALIHHNFPPSCSSAEELDNVLSTLSDANLLFPTVSTSSPIQERLAAYYAVGGVLLALPSPVAKRSDPVMRWPESVRLSKKTREARERLERFVNLYEITTSKREDLLLDVLPLSMKIDKNLTATMRGNLRGLCDFHLRGRMVVDEPDVEEEAEPVKGHTGGWLLDDDIEDD